MRRQWFKQATGAFPMHELGKLRELREADLSNVLDWRNAASVRANMYTQHVISAEEHARWWASVRSDATKRYFIFEFEGKATGVVGFTDIDMKSQNAFWAFYAAPSATKGTGRKMEYLALEYAFETMTLHKLCCEVLAFNTKVIELHKQHGFQIEGIFREQKSINGEFVDVYRLGIQKTEWQTMRADNQTKTGAL